MKKIIFTEEAKADIIQNYLTKTKNTFQIGEQYHCSRTTIERNLKEWGITLKQTFQHQDLTGQKFGKLTVIRFDEERYNEEIKQTTKPHIHWLCKCDCGNQNLISVAGDKLKSGLTTSCGCIKSLGEIYIIKILNDNNILYKKEMTFKNLKGVGGRLLRYDFAIFNNDMILSHLIEYHGIQHYALINGWDNPEEFEKRIQNDKIKEKYAKDNNIPLIIIPYTIRPAKIQLSDLMLGGDSKCVCGTSL